MEYGILQNAPILHYSLTGNTEKVVLELRSRQHNIFSKRQKLGSRNGYFVQRYEEFPPLV